jgi:D-3-phosphoglycerate dehydrogenase
VIPLVRLPVIALAAEAFSDEQERLVEYIKGRAELRLVDVASPEALSQSTDGAQAIVVTLQPLRAAHINALAPSVSVIGRAGVGLDSLDLAAAEAAGISVVNEPTYGVNEVASHAVAMLLALCRKLLVCDAYVRKSWQGGIDLGRLKPLDEMTVGVVGCGRIGSATAAMLRWLVGEVIVYDPACSEPPVGVEMVSTLKELLGRSDAVSLHVPLTEETEGMMDAATLAMMRPGALLVNVARGAVVDEDALVGALDSGQLGGAALDVFATEPLPSNSPLLRAPNTIFSPHCASYSERASWRLPRWILDDVVSWVIDRRVVHGNLAVIGSR